MLIHLLIVLTRHPRLTAATPLALAAALLAYGLWPNWEES